MIQDLRFLLLEQLSDVLRIWLEGSFGGRETAAVGQAVFGPDNSVAYYSAALIKRWIKGQVNILLVAGHPWLNAPARPPRTPPHKLSPASIRPASMPTRRPPP